MLNNHYPEYTQLIFSLVFMSIKKPAIAQLIARQLEGLPDRLVVVRGLDVWLRDDPFRLEEGAGLRVGRVKGFHGIEFRVSIYMGLGCGDWKFVDIKDVGV